MHDNDNFTITLVGSMLVLLGALAFSAILRKGDEMDVFDLVASAIVACQGHFFLGMSFYRWNTARHKAARQKAKRAD